MKKSQVTPYNQMLIPVLESLKSLGGSANIEELDNRAIKIMKLPDEMCNLLHKKENSNNTTTKTSHNAL